MNMSETISDVRGRPGLWPAARANKIRRRTSISKSTESCLCGGGFFHSIFRDFLYYLPDGMNFSISPATPEIGIV